MFFNVEPIPDYVKNLPLTVVQESTYGNMDSGQIEKCFENNILEAMFQGKNVIVPVFSLGRAQEIMYVLRVMQMRNQLSANIQICIQEVVYRLKKE